MNFLKLDSDIKFSYKDTLMQEVNTRGYKYISEYVSTYYNGKTIRDIARNLGVSQKTVRRWMKIWGMKAKSRKREERSLKTFRDMTKYNQLRNKLKTLDIVLFSGNGIISEGIKTATNSRWSHVGVVFNIKEIDMVCLLESTTLSTVNDALLGKGVSGVQIVPLSQRIKTYEGKVGIRQLNNFTSLEYHRGVLNSFRKAHHTKKYEQDKMELIKAAYDGPFGLNEEDLSSFFCSELVAELYQELGILDEIVPSNEYTPADFSGETWLSLAGGAWLNDIIEI